MDNETNCQWCELPMPTFLGTADGRRGPQLNAMGVSALRNQINPNDSVSHWHFMSQYRLSPTEPIVHVHWSGSELYGAVLLRAFPRLSKVDLKNAKLGPFNWLGKYCGFSALNWESMNLLFDSLCDYPLLDSHLDELFALDFHRHISEDGDMLRTQVGRAVYVAKPYDDRYHYGSQHWAMKIAKSMAGFIQSHPTYCAARWDRVCVTIEHE